MTFESVELADWRQTEASGPGYTVVTEGVAPIGGFGLLHMSAVASEIAEVVVVNGTSRVFAADPVTWFRAQTNIQVAFSGIEAGDLVQVLVRPMGFSKRAWVIDAAISMSPVPFAATSPSGGTEIEILTQPADVTGVIGDEFTMSFETASDVEWRLNREAADGTIWRGAGGNIGSTGSVTIGFEQYLDGSKYYFELIDGPFTAVTRKALVTVTGTATPLAWADVPGASETVAQGYSGDLLRFAPTGGTGTYTITVEQDGETRSYTNATSVTLNASIAGTGDATVTVTDGISTISHTVALTVTAVAGAPTFTATPGSSITITPGQDQTLTWTATGTGTIALYASLDGTGAIGYLGDGTGSIDLGDWAYLLGIGEHRIRVVAVDSNDRGAAHIVTITVSATAPTSHRAGVIPNGGTLPTGINAGDRIILLGVSDHAPQGQRAITAPSGFSDPTLKASGYDWIPDILVCSRTATATDSGRQVTFGGTNPRSVGYLIVTGGGPITLGGINVGYSGNTPVPAVGVDGLHAIFVVMSQLDSALVSGPGADYVLAGNTTPGYGAAALWTKAGTTGGPAKTVTSTGSPIANIGFGLVVAGAVTPAAPQAPVGVTAQPADGQVTISWNPVSATPAVSSYSVTRWNGSGFTVVGTPTGTTFTDTGLTNGTQYQYRVAAINDEGVGTYSTVVSATPTDTSGSGVEAYAPPAPNLSVTGATVVGPSDNLASMVAAGSPGQTFYLNNTSLPYTQVNSATLKANQRIIGAPGARIYGNNTGGRCFRPSSGAHNCLIANLEIYGFGTPGSQAQNIGVIDAKIDEWNEGTSHKGANWTIWGCTLRDNANTGISWGDNWTAAYNTIIGHSPQGIGGGFAVGGLIYQNYFQGNGEQGAPGSGVNNGQIKLVFHNVGPWGNTAHDTSRFRQLYTGFGPFQPWQHVTAAPSTLRIIGNTFDIRNGWRTRAVWFDLDVRDAEVAYNTFNDSINGVFYEGCNGGWNHHNVYNRCGAIGGFSSGLHPSKYFAASAACADSSSNLLFEYETFNDCEGTVMIFLGERGRNGADWVSLPNGYALVAEAGEQIRNNFNRILPGEASNVGSNDHIIRYCTLDDDSFGFGFVYQPEINRATEAWISTHESYGNVFGATQAASTKFFENGQAYSLAGWQALGRDT